MIAAEHAFTPLVVPRVGPQPTDVRADADKARVRGYAQGYAEGRRIALEEGRAEQVEERARMQALREAFLHERGTALEALRAALDGLERRVDELGTVAADRIEELALQLAEAVVGVEMSEPARSAAHALRRALHALPADRWTRVVFSERDAAMLAEDDAVRVPFDRMDIVASATVDPGGAILEIAEGAVDTRISSAFFRASAAWRGDENAAGPLPDGPRA